MTRPDAPPPVAPSPVCVIPAFNAERTVRDVVAAVRAALPEVFVVGVDDGSTDGTASQLRHGCDHVITFDHNRGKGAALRAALAFAAAERPGHPVITVDADGQHDAAFAPRLLEALSRADVVIGARQLGAVSVPAHRRLANRLSTAATRAVTRSSISDSQSGFRALSGDVVRSVEARGDRYEFETDFLVRAAHQGFRIVEVTVPTIYGPPSHFRALQDAWRVTRILWSHRSALFRRGREGR